MTRCRTSITVQWAVCRHDQTNEQKVDSVEDQNTVDDLLRGLGDLLLWVDGFSCGQTGQLSASVGKCGGDENTAESVEAIEEGGAVRGMPVSRTSVSGQIQCPDDTNQYLPPI